MSWFRDQTVPRCSSGSDIGHPGRRDVRRRGCRLLPGDAAAYRSGEPVGARQRSHTQTHSAASSRSCLTHGSLSVGVQGPRVLRVADGARPPVPPLRPRQRELLPGGEGGGGAAEAGHPLATTGGHLISGMIER